MRRRQRPTSCRRRRPHFLGPEKVATEMMQKVEGLDKKMWVGSGQCSFLSLVRDCW